MSRWQFPVWLGMAVAVAMFSPGCSCGGADPVTPGGSTGSGASTGSSGEGGAAAGSVAMGTGGGGQGGGELAGGVNATELVSAGHVAKSPSYRIVFTLGQPTQNQGKTTSPSYRMQGGLIGVNGSLP
jgi:hypothetical protein